MIKACATASYAIKRSWKDLDWPGMLRAPSRYPKSQCSPIYLIICLQEFYSSFSSIDDLSSYSSTKLPCHARTPLTWCSWTCLASSQTPTTTKTILSYCRSARTKMPFRKHSRKKTDTYKKWRHGIGEKLWNSKEKLRS